MSEQTRCEHGYYRLIDGGHSVVFNDRRPERHSIVKRCPRASTAKPPNGEAGVEVSCSSSGRLRPGYFHELVLAR